MTWHSEKMNQPEGILITMPAKFFQEYPGGKEQYCYILERMNENDRIIWGNTISSIPKLPVVYCYICYDGYVRYRLNIVDFEKNTSKDFNDGGLIRIFKNKNWVNLTGPVVKAPEGEFPKKGFQGFRYVQKLF